MMKSLQAGWQTVRANKRMIAVFYLANLFFGLMLMWPLRAMLKNFIGDSAMGERLGGALTVFAQGEKYTPSRFWGGAAQYFGRFCRLALWSLPVLALLFCLQYLESGAQRLFFGKDPFQNITYWGGWIKTGLRALSFLLFGMILDYARIHAVLNDENKMRASLGAALKFISKNFLSAFGLAFLLLAVGALALVIYNPLANSLAAPSGLVILLLFLLQQFYMLFRAALRLILYASQLHLYRALESAPAPAETTAAEEVDMSGLTPATE